MAKKSNSKSTVSKTVKPKWDRQAGSDNAKSLREAAKQRYGGLTRRQFNAKNSKHKRLAVATQPGRFEVVAEYHHSPLPQRIEFPNIHAALARFDRLKDAGGIISVKVVELRPRFLQDGVTGDGFTYVTIFGLLKTGQVFADSKIETVYRHPDNTSTLTLKAILASPRLAALAAEGKLEVAYQKAEGGKAWWESHRERKSSTQPMTR